MTKWIRPSGSEIETNDEKATTAYAESQGWKRKSEKAEKPKKSEKAEKPSDKSEV